MRAQEWRRKKARTKATTLWVAVERARDSSDELHQLRELHAHVAEMLHAYCTKKQLDDLYALGLPGPQGDLFRST